jgi:hypothetical protein
MSKTPHAKRRRPLVAVAAALRGLRNGKFTFTFAASALNFFLIAQGTGISLICFDEIFHYFIAGHFLCCFYRFRRA